jgi:hypothetical protein
MTRLRTIDRGYSGPEGWSLVEALWASGLGRQSGEVSKVWIGELQVGVGR